MAMIVNHNLPALQTYNVVNSTSSALQKSINKLSTGLRINSAADDAAGLAISEKMRAQIRGLDQATGNAQDGISMIQTAEGALGETHSILQRMRELSVQAANDTLTNQDRSYIQEEVNQLREEITRIGNTTQFNKKKLLNGDAAVLWSSSDSETKAIVNGGLRQIDQFGQKKSVEGNYNIKIKADPGQGEVQKSDIFKIKHENVLMNKQVNGTAGIDDVTVDNVPAGKYTLTTTDPLAVAAGTEPVNTGSFNVTKGTISKSTLTITAPSGVTGSPTGGSVELKVTVDGDEYTSTLNAGSTEAQVQAAYKTLAENIQAGLKGKDYKVTLDDSTPGTYKLTVVSDGGTAPDMSGVNTITQEPASGATVGTAGTVSGTAAADETKVLDDLITFKLKDEDALVGNASVLFEVTNKNAASGTLSLKATATILKQDGSTDTATVDNIVIGNKTADSAVTLDFLGTGAMELTLKQGALDYFSDDSKLVYNVTKGKNSTVGVELKSSIDTDWEGSWPSGPLAGETVTYGLKDTDVKEKDIHFRNYYLNDKTGQVTQGDIVLKTNSNFDVTNNAANLKAGTSLASFDAAYIGKVAAGDVKLRDLDKFWDSQGNFLLEDPQTITITQGDGKQASVTLYANDTLDDVATKLNNAIADDLGQGQYVNDASKFVTFTEGAGAKATSQSVPGTFLIRTVVPGANGAISLSGNEEVINAFSLNTIQDAKESSYTATITDAHSGATIASDVQVTGNKLIGVINPNVDVEFDAMAGIKANWDSNRKAYTYSTENYNTTLHLSDNTTVFQIGANEGEDMGVNIGDMRAHALGLDEVNVTNRESAARSITVIDNAIDKVSMQRSKLGAYQNRLEHTINNLTTAGENLTSAESRIRDTDMAKEMLNFSKLQIMLQAGNSMLAQANQLPQNVLSIIR